MSGPAICGIILAGGASRRLGGVDKALLAVGGRTMLANAVQRLQPQVEALAISTNAPAPAFAALGLPLLPDRDGARKGPLAGVLAGLLWARERECALLVAAAVDTPFFPLDLVARLHGEARPDRIAVACSLGRAHPTFALWPTALAPALQDHLDRAANLSMAAFLDSRGVDHVTFGDDDQPDPFFNVNTPQDLAKADELMRASS